MRVQFYRSMSHLLACVLCAASMCVTADAQTPAQNINMVSGTQWPGGDPFLQRQNEPSIAVSTRNPRHLLAGANDYRTVDLPLVDALPGVPMSVSAWLGLFKSFDGGQTWQSTLLPGYPQDQTPEGIGSPLKAFNAASDPVVRAGTNGLFFYSGMAFNRSLNSGIVFVSRFIDLNNKENGDATSTTGSTNRDPIRYIGTVVLDKGNSGQFLDKPWVAVDIPRAGAGNCTLTVPEPGAPSNTVTQSIPQAGNVYLAWSRFLGNDNTIRSKIYFSRSTDCGATWSTPILLSQTYAVNQGVSIAVNPVNGNVFVVWRTFAAANTTDGIAVAESTNGGQTFSKGIQIRSLPAFDLAHPAAGSFFDQSTISTGSGGPQFRTLAFPSIAIDGSGQIYVAWSERTPPYGDARIMMSTSLDGLNWTLPFAVDAGQIEDDKGNQFGRGHQFMPQLTFAGGKLMALYYDLRFDHTLGAFTPAIPTPPAPPFTPDGYPNPDSEGRLVMEERVGVPEAGAAVLTPFVNDAGLTTMRHTLEVRVAQFPPPAGSSTPPGSFSTARVSQFPFGTRGDFSPTIQQLADNPPNLPMFQGGVAPFMGDYVDIAGLTFIPSGASWSYNTSSAAPVHIATWTDNRDVQPPADGDWTHYTPIFAGTSVYDPTQTRPNCIPGATATRNQNIYSSAITQGLELSSPQNSKPLSTTVQRAFVVLVQNSTSSERSFRLTIANQPKLANGSADPNGFASFLATTNPPPSPQPTPIITLDVTIGPHAGVARPVFALSSNPTASIQVDVNEISYPGATDLLAEGLSSFLVLNQDGTVPTLIDPDRAPAGSSIASVEIYTPNVSSPNVSSPNVSSPNVSSPNVSSPNVSSPNVSSPNVSSQSFASPPFSSGLANPNVSSPNVSSPNVSSPNVSSPNVSSPNVSSTNLTTTSPVSDANYTITNSGNTSATYHIRLVSTQTVTTPLQLLIHKIYATPVAVGCSLGLQQSNILLAHVNNPPIQLVSSFDASDTGITDPSVSNATFTLAPGESALLTLRGAVSLEAMNDTAINLVAPVVVSQAANTNTNTYVVGAPGGIFPGGIFIITSTLPNAVVDQSYSQTLQALGGTPPLTWTVVGTLPPGLSLSSTGTISGTPTTPTGTYSFTVQVSDSAAHTAARTLAITTASVGTVPPLLVTSTSLPGGVTGVLYSAALTATGGIPPYIWSLAGGSLPTGLTLNSSGAIAGQPSGAGTFSFTAQVRDTYSQIASISLSITVGAAGPFLDYLVFVVEPSNTTAAQRISPAVQVQAFNATHAVLPGVNVLITIGTNPSGGTLSGTLTQTTTATGIATFSDLSIDRVGVGYTLVAGLVIDPTVTGTSTLFNIATSSIPVPQINQPLVPMSNSPGGAEFTLTVNGTGFVTGSVVTWNGSSRNTSYVTSKQLTATIPASDIATAGTAWVAVVNPGGAASNADFFQITNPTSTISLRRSDLSTGTTPRSVVVGDFNGDGKPDFAVANSASNTISVFLGSGDGTFQPKVDYTTGAYPISVATGDFNGDGKPDLAVANDSSGTVSIFLGNGDGTFQGKVDYGAFLAPWNMATGDFNGDGRLDLAVANAISPGYVSILLGRGDGSFAAPNSISTGTGSGPVVVGDFDGDGKLDLAVVNGNSANLVAILLGKGDGTFQAHVDYATGTNPQSLTTADFSSDGKLDLAVGNDANPGTVSILLGNGNGTFAGHLDYGVGALPQSVATGDFNGDGQVDLAVSNFNDNTVSILLGNGDGTFQTRTNYLTGLFPQPVAAGDFDGDGRLDLAVANFSGNSVSILLQTPIVSLSATSLSFGNQTVGTSSTAQTVTLTNTGSAPLAISNLSLSGASAANFTLTGTCPISPSSCFSSAAFLNVFSTASPPFSGVFYVTGPDVNGDRLVVGTPTGGTSALFSAFNSLPAPNAPNQQYCDLVPLAPGMQAFAYVPTPADRTGDFSAFAGLLIDPATGSAVPGGILSLSSSTFWAWRVPGSAFNSPGKLSPGATCAINVAFSPATASPLSGQVTIADNASGSPQTVSLSGAGTGTGTGTIQGTVTDTTGAAVPSASMTATNVSTLATYSTSTNAGGQYTLSPLPVGAYNVTLVGNTTKLGILVSASQTTTVNFP